MFKNAVWVIACWVILSGTAHAYWIERYTMKPPHASPEGVVIPSKAGLPEFTVTPTVTGKQIVRASLPFAPGTFYSELSVAVQQGEQTFESDIRVLTKHSGLPESVRRAMLTFEYDFTSLKPVQFSLVTIPKVTEHSKYALAEGIFRGSVGDFNLTVSGGGVNIRYGEQHLWSAKIIAPECDSTPTIEIIELGNQFIWVRMLIADMQWPRILEVKADSIGNVAVRAHLQQRSDSTETPPVKGYSPDFGWLIRLSGVNSLRTESNPPELPIYFNTKEPTDIHWGPYRILFPDAHLKQKGFINEVGPFSQPGLAYFRSKADDKLPHQEAAWRTASVVISPKDQPGWNAMLEPKQTITVAPEYWAEIYRDVSNTDVTPWDFLTKSQQFHQNAMATAGAVGDDYGNVASMPKSGAYSMNRLNHCPPIFHEYYRTGNPALRETAVQWCNNYYDLSIWWGEDRDGEFGGTRYNNRGAMGNDFTNDPNFMYRSNRAVHFCTKGYDSFFYAYEETGDPRYATALHWQSEYAKSAIFANKGESRNIGDVLDFVRLYEFTGQQAYLDNGLRLFRELREKLSPGDIFEQGGKQILPNIQYIDDDAMGTKFPFAKPYIMGYALAGLPRLAEFAPEEDKLINVIRAVADFMAESQDPSGGWRYPHPKSSHTIIGQGMEHSAQIARAAAFLHKHGEPIDHYLDAIERTLQSRIGGITRANTFLNGLGGWERATGYLKEGQTIYDLYTHPDDRDTARDYVDGGIGQGSTSIEGGVYFSEVMDFYLKHRPAERLLNANPQLETILQRMEDKLPKDEAKTEETSSEYAKHGMEQGLPIFNDRRKARMDFPLSWAAQQGVSFDAWKTLARNTLLENLLTKPPRTAFNPRIIASEDRGSHMAHKLIISISADNDIPAYLLIPKGQGPFPAVVALHDHGAHFSIGKEKVVRPFEVNEAVAQDAAEWTAKYYGGRYIGDHLASQGYVVFAIDALFWGERGRKEGVEYLSQQRLSANLLHLGMTWNGVITWDDIRSAEFIASLPEVDPSRIGAVGLSMGGHRTWMLAATSDHIAAGAAICWMGTSDVLTRPGNNQTSGHSAYSMLIPNLRNYLDYPDVASIAAPKPMLFYNGTKDGLFPIEGVENAYAKMQGVWDSQGHGDKLETKLWPVPHEFNAEMQDEAFTWLNVQLKP